MDNNSTDKTVEISSLERAVIVNEKKQGYGYAYKTGFQHATGEIIVTLDADGQYPASVIPYLLDELTNQRLDFITTNRLKGMALFGFNKEMPFINKLGNFFLSFLIRALYSIKLQDSQSGMWVFKKDILSKLIVRSNDMAFSQEIKIDAIYYNKLRWNEIEINYSIRQGKSKLNPLKHGILNLMSIIRKRFWR